MGRDGDKGVHAFPEGICWKLAYFDAVVQHFSHNGDISYLYCW